MTDHRPIGVFDSGVGGLTVLAALREVLPNESLLYLGDTARVPYGNKGADTIQRYARGAVRFLVERDVKAVVVACNTASAYALPGIADEWEIPIIGVIEPVANAAVASSRSGHIGVIGTRATVRSGAYVRAIERAGQTHIVPLQQPCPLFVPLAEEGWTQGPIVEAVASEYLSAFQGSAIDTLILGCTHYPLLKVTITQTLQRLMGRSVEVLDSATATAAYVQEALRRQKALRQTESNASVVYFVTDEPQRFADTGAPFLNDPLEHVEHIDLVT